MPFVGAGSSGALLRFAFPNALADQPVAHALPRAPSQRDRDDDKRQAEYAAHHRLPSSVVVRFTVIRSCAPQVQTSETVGSPTLRTRTCTLLPPAVVYGRPMTSHSPVSSASRSPT